MDSDTSLVLNNYLIITIDAFNIKPVISHSNLCQQFIDEDFNFTILFDRLDFNLKLTIINHRFAPKTKQTEAPQSVFINRRRRTID